MSEWTDVSKRLPPEGVTVEVITPGFEVRQLIYSNNLWWLPDQSMYVYFIPKAWRVLAKVKRYLVFGFDNYYPSGGWSDHVESYDDPQEALARARALRNDYSQVVDLVTGEELL